MYLHLLLLKDILLTSTPCSKLDSLSSDCNSFTLCSSSSKEFPKRLLDNLSYQNKQHGLLGCFSTLYDLFFNLLRIHGNFSSICKAKSTYICTFEIIIAIIILRFSHIHLTSRLRYVKVAFSSTFCVSPTARPICVNYQFSCTVLIITSSTNQQVGKQYWHQYDKYYPQYTGHSKVI